MRFIFLAFILLSLAACDTGISFQDRAQGTFSISQSSNSIEASSQSLLISEPIEIGLSRPVIYDSISTENVFLVEVSDASYAAGEQDSYLEGLCDSSAQVSASLYLDYPTLTLTMESDLNCESLYALCLSPELLFEEDLSYLGSTTLFETESCP